MSNAARRAAGAGRTPRTGEIEARRPFAVLMRTIVIGLVAFLTLVDLFATQAILPLLRQAHGVTPAAMGLAVSSVGAFRYATKKIEDTPRGFVEGPAWDDLIIGLTNVAKARHLPWKVSKGLDKASVEEPSAFVRLVRALQATFPEPSQRHQITYAATAQAICVARARKREISPVEG